VASYIPLTYWELAAASVFVFIDAGLSIIFGLKIHRSLLVAAIRMSVQLALVGLVLTTLFAIVSPLWTGILRWRWCFLPGTRQHSGRSGASSVGGPTGWVPAV
jgi:Uncharacterised protein family (UPF0014)